MGVDFRTFKISYDTYDTYDNLIVTIARCFDAKINIDIPENSKNTYSLFGFLNVGDHKKSDDKFVFSKDVPEILSIYCNHPYDRLNTDETTELYRILLTRRNDIKKIDSGFYIDKLLEELLYCRNKQISFETW